MREKMKTNKSKFTYTIDFENYNRLHAFLDETNLKYCKNCKTKTYQTEVGFYKEFRCLKCGGRE
jgi:hypothetical protein